MKRLVVLILGLAALLGCRQEAEVGVAPDLISFSVEPMFSVETKATEVTSLESFYVSAVTGTAGNEGEAWTSVSFNRVPASDPATYTANKYWPSSDPSYSFYASNRPLTFGAGGTTVSASNDVDVVCAYRTGNAYKSKNTLTFGHIFARLGTVTVVPVPGYVLTDIVIGLTPKTGGTYNLRTGEWADVTMGSATTIASASGENTNDLWLVPGDYTLTASWTARDLGGNTVSYSGKTAGITLNQGSVNAVAIALGGNITAGVDITEFVDHECVQNLEPLTMEALGDGNILWMAYSKDWAKTIEYSKDQGNTWTSVTATLEGAAIPVSTGDKVLLRGNNAAYGKSSSRYCYFSADVDYYLYGNMTDLLASGFKNRLERYCFYKLFQKNSHLYNHPSKKILLPSLLMADYCYSSLFSQCSNLTVTPELPSTSLAPYCYNAMFSICPGLTSIPELPANTLADSCYENMFSRCTGLTSVPELHALELAAYCYGGMFTDCTNLIQAPGLPASVLANYSYYRMFQGCTGLTVAPQLPATTLGKYCYYNMFNGCTGLTTAPVLPATTLAEYCYWQMFMDCTALTTVPGLPAEDLTGAAYCYYCMFKNCTSLVTPPVISATVIVNDCYKEMFSGCSSLATAPALPVTFLRMNCYQRMFYNCTSLTTAPDLPATVLSQGCYTEMFYGCSSLNYIRALFTTQPSTTFTQSWVSGVAANGTFVKNSKATWNRNDVQGVPYGWTIILE